MHSLLKAGLAAEKCQMVSNGFTAQSFMCWFEFREIYWEENYISFDCDCTNLQTSKNQERGALVRHPHTTSVGQDSVYF